MIALGTPICCGGELMPLKEVMEGGDLLVRQVPGEKPVIMINGQCGHQEQIAITNKGSVKHTIPALGRAGKHQDREGRGSVQFFFSSLVYITSRRN